MPDVFEDSVGGYDLTIVTSADWTIASSDLPNGDNAAYSSGTGAGTYYVDTAGTVFDIPWGSGSEAFTIEFWVKVTDQSTIRNVCSFQKNPTSGFPDVAYGVQLLANEKVSLVCFNSTGTYMSRESGTALSSGWHHVVFVIDAGSSRSITVYVDNAVNQGALTGPSGSPNTPGANWRFSAGQGVDGTLGMTDHMAKLAIYERALTIAEINDHYLAMVAS